jgi:hypothetical protein
MGASRLPCLDKRPSHLPFSGRIGGRAFLFCGSIGEQGTMDLNVLSEHWYCFSGSQFGEALQPDLLRNMVILG